MIEVSITVVSASRGTWSAPPRPGQEGAEHEDGREEPRLVDAERGDHLAVLGGGADQDAPARAVEEQPEAERDQRAEDDDREVVGGKELARDRHRAGQARRGGTGLVVGAPEIADDVGGHQHEREGEQELVELGRAVDAAEQQDLDQTAQHRDHDRRERGRARVEGRRPAGQRRGERVGQVGGEHVEGAVGEVDDARDAEDQREPGRDEEEEHRVGEAAQELDEEEGHDAVAPHHGSPHPALSPEAGERDDRARRG